MTRSKLRSRSADGVQAQLAGERTQAVAIARRTELSNEPSGLESQARVAGGWSVAQRTVSVAAKFMTVPLVVDVLGRERYGAWLTIVSAIAFLGWSDMGVPAALTNPLATSIHTGDDATARRLVGTGLVFLTLVALALGALIIPCVTSPDLFRVFGPSIEAFHMEFGATLAVVATLALLSLPLRLVDSIALAVQRVKWLAWTDTLAAVLTVAGVMVWNRAGGGLLSLAFSMLLPAVLGRACLWFLLARVSACVASPAYRDVRWVEVASLLKRGSLFTAGAAGEIVFVQTSVLFLSGSRGVDAVPIFAISFQIFSTAMQGIVALLWPMWGAYAQAAAKGEWDWIRRTHRRVLAQTLALAIAGFGALALVARIVITVWVGPEFAPTPELLLLFWVLFSVLAWCHAWNVLVMGLDLVRLRTAALVALGLMTVTLMPLTVRVWGIAGAPAGLLLALATTQMWMLPVFSTRVASR